MGTLMERAVPANALLTLVWRPAEPSACVYQCACVSAYTCVCTSAGADAGAGAAPQVLIEVAQAIQHLHSLKLIHCDIKVGNKQDH